MSTQDMEMYCNRNGSDFEEHFGILQSSAIQGLFMNKYGNPPALYKQNKEINNWLFASIT